MLGSQSLSKQFWVYPVDESLVEGYYFNLELSLDIGLLRVLSLVTSLRLMKVCYKSASHSYEVSSFSFAKTEGLSQKLRQPFFKCSNSFSKQPFKKEFLITEVSISSLGMISII